ncbi:MAG: phytoene/squalene synthase family protein [Candidatus Acetothermia bacterium]
MKKNEEDQQLSPFAYCREVTKERAGNFYWAIVTLPKRERRAIYCIYAFARKCDDIADGERPSEEKRILLDRQREQVDRAYKHQVQAPLYQALAKVVQDFDIPKKYFEELIGGVQMDLTRTRYSTFQDLRKYCYGVASTVGLILIEIFGYSSDKAQEHAVDLGIGMQLTNIIRDVKEDLQRGRIYIPREDFQEARYREEDLIEERDGEEFKQLIEIQAARARNFYASARQLFPYLPVRSRSCPAGLYGIYKRLLNEMESSGWDVLSQRIELTTTQKIAAVLRQWIPAVIKL